MNDKKETQDKSAALFMPISDLMIDAYDDIERRSNNPISISGITTGFDCLDQLIDGFHAGELIVVGGRTSMGKTALAISLAYQVASAEPPHPVSLFSMSISNKKIALRMLSATSRVKTNHIDNGQLKAEDWSRLASTSGVLDELNIQVGDHIESLDDLRAACKWLKQSQQGLDLVVLDDLQSLPEHLGSKQRNQDMAKIMHALKTMAKELAISVVVTTNLKHTSVLACPICTMLLP